MNDNGINISSSLGHICIHRMIIDIYPKFFKLQYVGLGSASRLTANRII
ncbi:hypothetical protein AHYW_004023 [Providencia manganoxydans]